MTAQLMDTQTGYHIWSQNYHRPFDEIFAVQDDIAFNIAQSLKLTLDESSKPDSRKAMTGDIEAFKLYLKGRELLNDRIFLRTEGLYEALEYFSQAIEKDPKFARAHAAIATVYWLLTTYDASLEKEAYFEQAETSARYALEIDPAATDNGELNKLVSFESLLILGSPHAFDLDIDPLRDITKVQIYSQVWNNWAVALRREPRFKDWVRALGYVEYWRKYGWPDRCRATGPDDFECI